MTKHNMITLYFLTLYTDVPHLLNLDCQLCKVGVKLSPLATPGCLEGCCTHRMDPVQYMQMSPPWGLQQRREAPPPGWGSGCNQTPGL